MKALSLRHDYEIERAKRDYAFVLFQCYGPFSARAKEGFDFLKLVGRPSKTVIFKPDAD